MSIGALCFFVLFMVMWVVWFVSMHYVRFSHGGKVCSGDLYFLEGAENYFIDMGYAVHQGKIMRELNIAEWVILLIPICMEVVLEIFIRGYLKYKNSSRFTAT